MSSQRRINRGRLGIVFGVVAMVFLIGVSPVMAELQNPQPLDIGQPKTYPSFSIFSPAPNYLAIQTPTTDYHSDNIFTAVLEGDFTNTGGHPQLQSFSDIIRCHGLSGQAGNPCQAGFRSAYINGVNYIFAYDFVRQEASIINCGQSTSQFILGVPTRACITGNGSV